MLNIIGYVLSVLAANFTAANFVSFGPFTLAVGTLFFGITFTIRDRIHVLYGKRTVYFVIAWVIGLSIVQSMFLSVDLRIIVASAIAMLLAESTDTEVFHSLASQSWHIRVLRSNAISIPIDTVLFTLIAFAGILPFWMLISVIITDTLVKYAVSAAIVAYKVPKKSTYLRRA